MITYIPLDKKLTGDEVTKTQGRGVQAQQTLRHIVWRGVSFELLFCDAGLGVGVYPNLNHLQDAAAWGIYHHFLPKVRS